jgi:RNA polymerase sigma-70 factor (ECF subfamily)
MAPFRSRPDSDPLPGLSWPLGPSPAEREEAAWIDSARAGDREAQERLLRLHYGRVHATAFRLIGNPEDAEDLAQECFVRAFRSLEYFRGDGCFGAWLRRIVVHLCQDRFRSRGRQPEPLPLPPEVDLVAPTREPGRGLEQRELARLLDQSLAALAAPLRVTLLLRVREGLEYEDIARATGVTPATARTRVMKARKELGRLLGRWLDHALGTSARRPGRSS